MEIHRNMATGRSGFTIAFLGTDGSGKTTIIDRVIPLLNASHPNRVRYEHLRPNWIPPMSTLAGKGAPQQPDMDPHTKKQSGTLGSLFRFGYYFLDYTVGYWLKIFPGKAFRSDIWIFDRYYYEYLIDPRRTRVSLPRWFIRACQRFVPEPQLIICLGADPETIFERKPEMELKEVERQVVELSDFCSKHKNAVWVDTGCSIDESVEQTMMAIRRKIAV